MRVEVNPRMLTWARERAGMSVDGLTGRFARLAEWEAGSAQPTLKQLQRFAAATHAPFGLLLLDEPPIEEVPLPDFRTFGDARVRRASPELLDTIHVCEQRQEWYRTYAQQELLDRPSFIGSASTGDPPREVGSRMRATLGYEVADRAGLGSWDNALGMLRDQAEAAGILVMISGIVGSNTHRRLQPEEFRGFTLADPIAPVVFVNGADTKAAQIFTLAHEVAHVWLGGSALGNATVASDQLPQVERWCNEAAAELLVPAASVVDALGDAGELTTALERLARYYRVSTLVVLRRIADVGLIARTDFWRLYQDELGRVLALKGQQAEGGDFYNTTPVRASKRFTRALIQSTLEGHTLYRDTFNLLGFKKYSTFEGLVEKLGVG